jgi:spore germination protein
VHFVTYDGVDLATVERRFDVSAQALQRANPMLDEASEPSPGTELVIPGLFGFSYRAQVGDTWQTLAAAYSLSADELARINGLPVDSPLPPGTTLLIPATVSAERAPAPSHQ